MKNLNYILKYAFSLLFVVVAFSCDDDSDLESELSNYANFEIGPAERAITVGNNATQSYDIKVYTSEVSGSDRTFGVTVDAAATTLMATYNVPAQVTVPANSNEGTLSFTITDNESLGFVAQKLVFGFTDEVGMDFGGNVTYNVTEECLDTIATLSITLDTWPDETSWEIYDLADTSAPIHSGPDSPYVNPDDDFLTKTYDFCLPAGNYAVVVYDSYGDGGPSYDVSANGTSLASGSVSGFNAVGYFDIN